MISGVFVLFFLKIMRVKKWGNCSDPQLDPHGEMRGKGQRAPGKKFAFLSGAFEAVSLLLHYLCHEAAHGFRRLILHLPGSVGVSTQGVHPPGSGRPADPGARKTPRQSVYVSFTCHRGDVLPRLGGKAP